MNMKNIFRVIRAIASALIAVVAEVGTVGHNDTIGFDRSEMNPYEEEVRFGYTHKK